MITFILADVIIMLKYIIIIYHNVRLARYVLFRKKIIYIISILLHFRKKIAIIWRRWH